jgi:hypothetical protein
MRSYFFIALSLHLISCGPRFHTSYQLTPPKTPTGMYCINSCQGSLQQCESSQQYEYQGCLNRVETTYQVCEAGKEMGPDPLLGWAMPICIKNCHCSRDSCSRPDSELCQARYRSCYQGCGGTVTSTTICVANCEKLVPQARLQDPGNSLLQALARNKEGFEELCDDSDYDDFLELAPCDEDTLTLEQLANRVKLEPDLIPIVSSFRSKEKKLEEELAVATASLRDKRSARMTKLIRETSKKSDQLYLKLVGQKLSIGEFNKARQDLRLKFKTELSKIGR